jgi:transposase
VETGGRRRWSDAEKLRIVEESELGDRQVSATARRNGISRTLLMSWRRGRDEGRRGFDGPVFFTPVAGAPDLPITQAAPVPAPAASAKRVRRGGRIEIELNNGRRITVGPDVEPAAVARPSAAAASACIRIVGSRLSRSSTRARSSIETRRARAASSVPVTSSGMTAASCVLHEKFHSEAFTRKGGTLKMVQL